MNSLRPAAHMLTACCCSALASSKFGVHLQRTTPLFCRELQGRPDTYLYKSIPPLTPQRNKGTFHTADSHFPNTAARFFAGQLEGSAISLSLPIPPPRLVTILMLLLLLRLRCRRSPGRARAR